MNALTVILLSVYIVIIGVNSSDANYIANSLDDDENFDSNPSFALVVITRKNKAKEVFLDSNESDKDIEASDTRIDYLLRRSKPWRSCLKKAAKICTKACKDSIKDACSFHSCKRKLKKTLKKECKRNCKSRFDD